MGKVLRLKRRADSILEDVFRALFEEIDTAKIRAEVTRLNEKTPGYEPAALARQLSRRTAIRCAAAGALTGLPAGIAAIPALGADLAYLVYQQFRLILGIAIIYGHEPTARERFTEAVSCLAYASGVGIGKEGIARLVRDRMARAVPLVGAVSGGALNYFAILAAARSAVAYYEEKVDAEVADEIWAEGDREHA
jgi:hypothetical protein